MDSMFEASLARADNLRKIVEAVRELVREAPFVFSEDGISVQAMDSSHVSLVSITLSSQGFEDWRCDEPFDAGISIENLSTVLKCASKDDRVCISVNSNDCLGLTFKNAGRSVAFELKLIDAASEGLSIPSDLEHASIAKIPSSTFQSICRDLSNIGDTVTVEITPRALEFAARGDIGTASISLEADSNGVDISTREPIKQGFALRYLVSFAKATPLSDFVTLRLSPDLPMLVEYVLPDNLGQISYFLAPKLDDDDDEEEYQNIEVETVE